MHIGLTGWAKQGTLGTQHEFLRLFERADILGYDSIWLNEFHFMRMGLPYPSPLLLAAAIFARTSRLRVGLSVVILPIYNPLILAEELAQLDWQSNGRLDVGLGRGARERSLYHTLGIEPETSRERFELGCALLVQAWTQDTVSATTPYWHFENVAVGPPPVQSPHPPLYIGANTEETIAFAARRGWPLLLSLEPAEARQLALYRAVISAQGLRDDHTAFSVSRYICIAASRREADSLVDKMLPDLQKRRQHSSVMRRQAYDESADTRAQFVREQAIVGTPDDCIRQLRHLRMEKGFRHLRCVFNGSGLLDNRTALAGMELFAREVLPVCKAL